MIVTHKISMDLTRQGIQPHINVIQDDKYSRNLELTLYSGGQAWEIPEDAIAIVRYSKSDGTGGNYDTLPDGTQSYTINGNVLTVALAPQVCTAPGLVQLAVGLIDGETEINTFTICVNVQWNPGIGVASESYFKIAGALPDSGWTPNMYLGTDAEGKVVAVEAPDSSQNVEIDTTLTQSGKAADAKAVGDALEALSEGMSSEVETDLYDPAENTNRQYYDTSGALVTDVYGWYTTADMDVSGKSTLTYGGLTNTANAANARSVFKDADGGIVSVFLPSTGENQLDVPAGASSVAFTLHMNDIETFYAKVVVADSLAGAVISGWYDKLGDRIKNLLSKATEKKICCIVDDDTIDTECVTLFKTACDANGIKGTLATLTYNWTKDTALKDTLLSMERDGFQTVIHAYAQNDYWSDPEANAADCESNLVHGMQEMEAAGFLDYKYWVTPYCKDTEGIQSMARKRGMNCALAGGNTYEPADDTYGRFALRRAAFGPNDTDSSITLAQLQTIAQEAANNNGWLIVMTHFEAWKNAGGDYSRFTSLIDYLKGLGYEFMTLAEAWSYRKTIYDVYDMF